MFLENCGAHIMAKAQCPSITVPPTFAKKGLLASPFLPLNLKKKNFFQFPICLKKI
ncbi:hypothetical protein Tmel_1097 [Thermosipho melanesiensis BI429]|uniref:Uncharacterized protein n=1 Tax=Thermosipho melanesiensis (strain DSM 12029 / CIP 104789 / BI429) TaxID=391009 RepID=A6LM05_THEM4|nr:hypothetical protein Tmel_1097 [Thermosipho melanesiensis BI429]